MTEMGRVAAQEAPIAPAPALAAIHHSRRILPNLMIPAPAAPEQPIVETPEPRLPRVRRVAARTPKAVAQAAPVFQAAPYQASPPPIAAAALPPRAPRAGRKEAPALRAGERWKRRLPKACW